MKHLLTILCMLFSYSVLLPHNDLAIHKKKYDHYYYSKIATTLIVGPLIGYLIGIANKNSESTNAKMTEKIILYCVFGFLNGIATRSVSSILNSLNIPHDKKGLQGSSWLTSWITYLIVANKITFQKPQLPSAFKR